MINRSSGSAEALIPVEESREIIAGVRKSSIAMQLLKQLPNMSSGTRSQPVLSMLPIADFVNGDAGMKISTEAAWDKKLLVAGEIAAIIPVPQAVIDDADYDIWGECRPLLHEAFGRVFDKQVFSARNPKAPTEWPDPIIVAATAAGNVVAEGTNTDIAEDFNQLFGLLEEMEYDVTGVASLKSVKTKLRGLRNSNGTPIYQDTTAGSPANIYAVPTYFVGAGTWNNTNALSIAGDWGKGVYSIRQDMTFQIFDTGVISDDAGKVVYNLMQQDMVAMRAVMRLAWQIANPIDIDRPAAEGVTYYPFGVLTP